jgi:hypothetical protein
VCLGLCITHFSSTNTMIRRSPMFSRKKKQRGYTSTYMIYPKAWEGQASWQKFISIAVILHVLKPFYRISVEL